LVAGKHRYALERLVVPRASDRGDTEHVREGEEAEQVPVRLVSADRRLLGSNQKAAVDIHHDGLTADRALKFVDKLDEPLV
jgi:hypothetical protein